MVRKMSQRSQFGCNRWKGQLIFNSVNKYENPISPLHSPPRKSQTGINDRTQAVKISTHWFVCLFFVIIKGRHTFRFSYSADLKNC